MFSPSSGGLKRSRVDVIVNPVPLFAYRHLADAWAGGVADWCAAAARFALTGGQAWCVTAGPGPTGWMKQHLLAAATPVFGVRFLDSAADLRRAAVRSPGGTLRRRLARRCKIRGAFQPRFPPGTRSVEVSERIYTVMGYIRKKKVLFCFPFANNSPLSPASPTLAASAVQLNKHEVGQN